MASTREKVRLVSSAGTGFHYYTYKNRKNTPEKLKMRKYDPVKREHVEFNEQKMPSHSKK
jgi:large subunit ribosomal protein L33